MKNFLLPLFLSLFIFSGCSEDDNDNVQFKARINGELFEATDFNNINLIHDEDGQILTIFAENDDYEFTIAVAEYAEPANCMSTGVYLNDEEDRECIVWLAYKMNGNTYQLHLPTEEEDNDYISSERVNITECANGKVSGTFSVTLEKIGNVTGIDAPDIIEITDGEFNDLEFDIY